MELDRGVTTPGNGDDRTSYIVGGNLCLSESTGGGTQFNVGSGDTLYVGTQITLCTGLASSTQFSLINGGVGTLVLAASNNFTASTQTSNGTLVLANTAALSASPLVINGGYVAFSGITQNFPLVSLSGNGGTLVLANTNNSPVNVSVGGGRLDNLFRCLDGQRLADCHRRQPDVGRQQQLQRHNPRRGRPNARRSLRGRHRRHRFLRRHAAVHQRRQWYRRFVAAIQHGGQSEVQHRHGRPEVLRSQAV